MLPDWQKVNRLLVACSFSYDTVVNQLKPSMQVLKHSLPHSRRMLLTSEATGYVLQEQKQTFNQACTVELITQLRHCDFDAAIIFTEPYQSCCSLAYICYLSIIPVRLGQSLEFSGTVLSRTIKPPTDPLHSSDYHLHLLAEIGFPITSPEYFSTHQV